MLSPEMYTDPNREQKDEFLADTNRLIPQYYVEEHYGYPTVRFDAGTSTQAIYDTLQTLSDHWNNNLPEKLTNDEFAEKPIGYIIADERGQLVYPENIYIGIEGDHLITQDNDTIALSSDPIDDEYLEKYRPIKVRSYRDGGNFPPIRQMSHFDDVRPEESSEQDPMDFSDLPMYHDVTGRRNVRDAIDEMELPGYSEMPELDDLRSEIDRYKTDRPRINRDPKEEYRGGMGRDPRYRQRRGRGRMN